MIRNKLETCIGVLGGGQLGRMLALEARKMGFRVVMWTNEDSSGAARLADHIITESFNSTEAFKEFVHLVDVATVEFENIPSDLMEALAKEIPLMPDAHSVAICQNREKEKSFLAEHGIPTAPFRVVDSALSLHDALQHIAGDVILKTIESGYDGKGQMLVLGDTQLPDVENIWREFGDGRAIVEQKIDLAAELSVIVVRSQDGETVSYDPSENQHQNHILDISIIPARMPASLLNEAKEIAIQVAQDLNYVGVLGVEFFLDQSGKLRVNEMAPRPHNSGHHTLDACETSQFEQQLRVICHLPLGSTRLLKPAVMLNLLGDLWPAPNKPPEWAPVLATPGAKLHLYGKKIAKPRRKMGHVTFLADTLDIALERVNVCKKYYGMDQAS